MSRDTEMFRLLVEYGDLAVQADHHHNKHRDIIDHYQDMTRRMAQIKTAFDAHEKYKLTERELQVMQGISQGLTNETIGAKLYISPETVRTHIRKTMDKLKVRTRAHAVSILAADGIVDPHATMKHTTHVETISEVARNARRKETSTERVLRAV